MDIPNNDHNISPPRRSLLGTKPQRVVRSVSDGDKRDIRDSFPHPHPFQRIDRSLPSRKRSINNVNANSISQEPKRLSFLESPLVDRISTSKTNRKSSLSESRHSLSMSSKSSLSSDISSHMLPPAKETDLSVPENLQNIIYVNTKPYIKLKQIGKGGSSEVYRVLNESDEILALKCVNLRNISENQYRSCLKEVEILQSLRGSPGIIDLIDYELNKKEDILYILMECGETDLKTYLNEIKKQNQPLSDNFIRLAWQQMLSAVHFTHQQHIIHSDLKPANFLFVKGTLKLIDFGIASSIEGDATSIFRESHVGTLNYFPPEGLIDIQDEQGKKGSRIRQSSDVWSLGCILYEMVYQKSPWGSLPFQQKLLAIVQDSYQIPYPDIANPWLLNVIQSCLQRDPKKRPRIDGADGLLEHPFLKPQGVRAMQLYKGNAMNNERMKEVVKQIHKTAKDERWKMKGIIPLVTNELVVQCAKNKPVDIPTALDKAVKKLSE